jgi:GAF domain
MIVDASKDRPVPLDRATCQRSRAADLVRLLLAEARTECAATGACLWLRSPGGEYLDATLNSGPAHEIMESASVPIADSVVGMVASTGIATSIGPGDRHNPSIDAKTGIQTRAMIVAPVYLASELCGVVSAINPISADIFAGEQLRKLQWKAYLVGLVLADQPR